MLFVYYYYEYTVVIDDPSVNLEMHGKMINKADEYVDFFSFCFVRKVKFAKIKFILRRFIFFLYPRLKLIVSGREAPYFCLSTSRIEISAQVIFDSVRHIIALYQNIRFKRGRDQVFVNIRICKSAKFKSL